ncbi:MAG: biotin/lipoyl-containing protein [Symbiobacterium sp.]|uniref:biotin/lipoyl-containing protein n=1 Tax=Symbiobacterium sp. TaxID=1971213 RepID=UPI003463CE93
MAPAAAGRAAATPAAAPAPAGFAAASAAAAAPSAASAAPAGQATGEGMSVCAPLPGMVVEVKVAVGQQVREGDVVAVLEAMKMENDITSPYSGTVKQVLVEKGASVGMNDPLVVIG